ncbi:hypothetical protein PQR75_45405 [Paraburkholderia fungorum]|uniref:hypothetical protein n=1 Tax=Paraburkholderia fungorum TaxID=134537 RepID=UPI0038BD0064
MKTVPDVVRNGLDVVRNAYHNEAMISVDKTLLARLAQKYIWWKTPDEAIAMPERVVAQVMNIGDYGDVQEMVADVGDNGLREVIAHAEIGQFDARSWAYWHYRLGLAKPGDVPPLPTRRLA